VGLVGLALLLLPEVALPRPTELTAAAGDVVELERLATRLGPARLLTTVESAASRGQSRLALVALRGVGLLGAAQPELGVALLRPFSDTLLRLGQARRLDEKQAQAASDSLQRVASAVGRSGACVGSDQADCGLVEAEAAESLLRLATTSTLPLGLRSGALDGLSQLPTASWQQLLPKVVSLATAGPTAPQRAALTALATQALHDRSEPLLGLLRSGEPAVATAAAAELCMLLPNPPLRSKVPPLLSDELAGRVRGLAAPSEPLGQRLQLVDCLRLLGTPADRALLQQTVSEAKRGRR
jgi:hypothetical protein